MRHGTRFWATLVAVVALVAGGSSALADHLFPDSTDEQAFHEQVGYIAGAGCATGFDDGTFRPNQSITRQQFAAWMNRCGGRAAEGSGGQLSQTASGHTNAVVDTEVLTIEAGAAASDVSIGGFVLVQGSVIARTADAGDCPCFVQASVATPDRDGNLEPDLGVQSYSTIPAGLTDIGEGFATIPVEAVLPVEPGEVLDIGFRAFFVDANASPVAFEPRLTALYVPFGPDGDNTLPFE